MSKSVKNFVELVGSIKWPETKFTLNGTQLFKAKLVIPGKKGSTYLRIVAWDDMAERLGNLGDNAEIKLHGHLVSRSFDSKCKTCKTDHKVYVTEVVVDNFIEV